MLTGRNIICFSSIDWDFLWQGHQEVMASLAANGNRVLFIENTGVRAPRPSDFPRLKARLLNWWRSTKGFRQERENLFVYSPLLLPFPYSRLARVVNRFTLTRALGRWMRIMHFSEPIFWTFLPTPLALDLMDRLDPEVSVYYCIDNLAASSPLARKIRRSETLMLKRCDLVFTTSSKLYEAAARHRARVYLFPFGVNIAEFEVLREPQGGGPEELGALKRPIVGYVGGIHKWIDQALLATAAEQRPDASFVLVGPVQTDVSRLRRHPNIHLLGARPHAGIPLYINAFDVAIIPYLLNEYTDHVYPTKLNEYLALGKPVVATDLAELRRFNETVGPLVVIAKNTREFSEGIERAMRENSEEHKQNRIRAARLNSWQARIEAMSKLIREQIALKRQQQGYGWQVTLLRLSKLVRRRVLTAASVLLGTYLLVFYSPVAWYLADPLKVADAARRADAIVVLAGGVGESGVAGEGYQERVKLAVELYQRGYADRLIFSSGYLHAYKEADVMKALAVSLGVPPEAIILETKASNTYGNVIHTRDILRARGWRSILLVSSPFHMRRAALTFRKLAPEVNVIHTPIPHSQFYSHTVGASLPQIRGILHEYAGIAYYWWKGWV